MNLTQNLNQKTKRSAKHDKCTQKKDLARQVKQTASLKNSNELCHLTK